MDVFMNNFEETFLKTNSFSPLSSFFFSLV